VLMASHPRLLVRWLIT